MMDDALRKQLESIEAQIEVLYLAEEKYLTLDAAKEHKLATLMAPIQASSHAAKDMAAKATAEWISFKNSLAISEAEFHKQRHLLDLKNLAFNAHYLSLKVEAEAIKRGVG